MGNGTLLLDNLDRFPHEADVAVSPPKAVDAQRLSFPLPFMLTLGGLALVAVGGVWKIEEQVSVLTTTISYERQLDAERAKYLDQRFAALELKIDAAANRGAALNMAQELSKLQNERRR